MDPDGLAINAKSDIKDVWSGTPLTLASRARSGLGYSLEFGGAAIGPALPSGSTAEEWHDGDTGRLRHDSGLVVERSTRVVPEFVAVEYQLRVRNDSDRTLERVSRVNALDISFALGEDHRLSILSSGGGLTEARLPPRTFAIRCDLLSPTTPHLSRVELTTQGGRSSYKDLPFFLVHDDVSNSGVFVAFGWTGQWHAEVRHDANTGVLSLMGTVPDLDIALEPGEELRGPSILIGGYGGSVVDGSNTLRRIIREKYSLRLDGAPFQPAAVHCTWWNTGVDFDEESLKDEADGAAAIGQEYFLLDAGWYQGSATESDFSSGLGNWFEVNGSRLPNGLGPVADHVRSTGMKFGLWFEPERVAVNSRLAKEHPEWVLWERMPESELSANRRMARAHRSDAGEDATFGLLDYGRPDVQRWVREMLDRYIRDYGVALIKHDFNADPLAYWDANDTEGRRGVTQLRYVQGLYAIFDWLHETHPGVVLECCASGGRRIDFETAKRFHLFSISDHNIDPAIMRYHLFGVNHFLPASYAKLEYTLPVNGQTEFDPDDLGFRSLFGGAFGSGGRVDRWPDAVKERFRAQVDIWKSLRHYLVQDYYPLTAQPADLESWSGWQFHDPREGSGFVQTFRTRTAEDSYRFRLYGLEDGSRYTFTDVDTGDVTEIDGSAARSAGIEVEQPAMTSRILTYRLSGTRG